MRVEYLSDHGGEQLSASEQAMQQAEAGLAIWRDQYAGAHRALQAARRAKPVWKKIFSVSTPEERVAQAHIWDAWRNIRTTSDVPGQAQNQFLQQSAGVEGEDMLEWGLSGLSDQWCMFRGYQNRRGETDAVIVGPDGVWAVEVKRRRVRLHAIGDEWWFDKLDARGSVVDTSWAVDGGDRSCARKVNEIARDLGAWLRRRCQRVWVRTAVMLMQEQAQIGDCARLRVDLVGTHPRHLLDAIDERASTLRSKEYTEIVRLVRRDHQFHSNQ